MIVAVAALLALAPPTQVDVWVSKNVAPGKNVRLNINTRNLPVVHISAFPTDGEKWLSRDHEPNAVPDATAPVAKTWDVTVKQPGQQTNPDDAYFSRQVNVPITKPGVYRLEVAAGGKVARSWVNVTSLAVVAKRSSDQGLIWVTDHKTGHVVPGAPLHFYDRQGHLEDSSTTGPDGARLLALTKATEIAVVRRGKDIASVRLNAPNYDGRLNAFWQTDRPIYRPGQDIEFKAVLRLTHGQGYDPITGAPVRVKLLDPKGNPVDQADFKSNDNGSVAGKFNIPSEGMLGAYTLELIEGERMARESIRVAEYRKPEFKVDLASPENHYLAGETVRYKLHASYYFGAPLPQASVRWLARSSGLPFQSAGEEEGWFYSGDGNLYPRDTFDIRPFVAEGNTFTDNNGDAIIEVKSEANRPDSSYTVEAVVTDPTHRQITADASVPVYSSMIRLSVSPEIEAVAVGGLVPLQLRAVDLQGRPVSTTLRLRVLHDVWDKKKDEMVPVVLTTANFQIPSTGRARATVPALAEGTLTIEATAKDSTGRSAISETTVWGESLTYKPPKEKVEPELHVRLNKRVYEPGDQVKAFVSSNVAPRPMLIVEEGREIWAYRVLSSSSLAYQFKTDKAMSPNCFLSATEWVDHRLVGDSAAVPLPDRDRELRVSVLPDKTEYRPGDKASYRVETKDRHGHPVSAEVSLAVVDEAIYALSPDSTADPYRQYWGFRQNQVMTAVTAPEELSGGAYQRANAASPSVRTRFEDTAYWNAFIQTDGNGEGTASFEVPGNLTSWRATARTITPTTSVGVGKSSVLATRPLTLRLALPRQMTIGDHLQVLGTVNNRTSQPAIVHVRLTGPQTDYTLEGDSAATITVPANGQAVVPWTITANDEAGTGSASFQAEAVAESGGADMADALRMNVPVVPRGYRSVVRVGGVMQGPQDFVLELPADANPKGIRLTARISAGAVPAMQEQAREVLETPRYGSPAAADQLVVAGTLGWELQKETVREDLALLSRTQNGEGWGWWENLPPDVDITASVLHSLAVAKSGRVPVPDSMIQSGWAGAQMLYNSSQLWEQRALLASSMAEFDAGALNEVDEVVKNGKSISPYARLRLAEALLRRSSDAAVAELETVLPLVSRGPVESYLPVGEGVGWTASDIRTTAELLAVLARTNRDRRLQNELVAWLVSPDQEYGSEDDHAEVVHALAQYLTWESEGTAPKLSPPAPFISPLVRFQLLLGPMSLAVGGQKFELDSSNVEVSASKVIVDAPLKPGKNVVHLNGKGRASVSLTAEFYRPATSESHTGVRVARKYEVRNGAGVWTEIDRAVATGEPVRVTLSVWGDDISDAVKVDEPIPAGFEFVDSEVSYGMREEVRDGKLIHYLANAGTPTIIRYYLRAETTGFVVASPPSGQYLRRPAAVGHGVEEPIQVIDGGHP